MRRLPPLNGIKAFEAAARAGSFTGAALELGVSSAAVSQQVQSLEAYFGKRLFVRQGNRITLTDAGHAIHPQTSRALGDLAAVASRLLDDDLGGGLVVSAPYSLAELWLAPKLSALMAAHPRMPIEVRAEEDPVEFLRHDIDIRISYGGYHYPGLKPIPLVRDTVLAVCAPAFWRHHNLGQGHLADLPEDRFIHTDWGPNYASHPTWADWFAAAGLSGAPDPARGHRMGLSTLAIAAARHGAGVALGQRTMARLDLEASRLIALSSVAVPVGQPYVAFLPRPKRDRPAVQTMLTLLR